ncbi:MAG TPA: amino acid adenylation domain-containing protein [Jatrophihabitans sp.]|jgi:amino acid adenylation domain-containing protein|uniref:amino acid adenylation domain-containing protein n=1 Tax=Jatrophihabitans sp. TaxID=1932789 RepID=UPI002EEC33CF
MRPSPVEDILPLSPLQEGLLFHALLDRQERNLYVAQYLSTLHGPVDAGRLQAAATALLRCHPNLRVGFRYRRSGDPVQVVRREAALDWTDIMLSGQGDAALTAALDQDWARGIDISGSTLLRFLLVREAVDRHRLVITAHHCVLDGWSIALVLQELFTLYAGQPAPPVAPFRSYLAWVAGQDGAGARAAWQAYLAGVEPTRLARTAVGPSRAPEVVTVELSKSATAAVQARAREQGVTLNTIVQAVWAIQLAQLTGRADVVFGCTVSGRPAGLSGADTMIGMMANTVAVRARFAPQDTIADLLSRIQDQRLALLEHDHLGLSDIQRAAGVDGALFDTTVALENYLSGDRIADLDLGSLRIDELSVRETSHYPLTLVVVPGDRLVLRLHYRPNFFDGADVNDWANRLPRLLELVATQPDRRLAEIEPLEDSDRDRLLRAWAGPGVAVPADKCIHHLFQDQAARTPDAVSLIFGDQRVSYAQLNEDANRLGHYLSGLGVRPGGWVGVHLERGVELVVAILAVMKAGGAYVLLDSSHPEQRLAWALAHTGASVLITQSGLADRLRPAGVRIVDVHADAAAIAEHATLDFQVGMTPEDVACLMFTSGSQGHPKGVMASHRCIVGTLAAQDFAQFAVGDVVLQCSPLSWDAFAFELLGPLLAGATCVLQPGAVPEPAIIARLMAEHRVSTAHFSASLLNYLLDEHPGLFDRTRQLLTGGEAASMSHMRTAMRDYPELRIVNAYSPLECMMVTVWHRIEPADIDRPSIPLGRPVANKQLYVLNANLQVVPSGTVGELYLAGVGLTHGYLGQAGLTAERFVANPYDTAGERMYRTGDLVRWTSDEVLEFFGRADDQFKLRGFRIEPAEVEAAIANHDDVAEARVVIREDRPGDKRLVAYLIARSGASIDSSQLRGQLSSVLPTYMHPAAFVTLERFPIMPNGKLDRRALPEPDYGTTARGTPRDIQEQLLCALFADVLSVPEIGIHDDFFQLGGHSLLAIRLVSRVRAEFDVELNVAALFRKPTVAGLSEQLTEWLSPVPPVDSLPPARS